MLCGHCMLLRTGGEWYAETCPTPFDFRSAMPDTVYWFTNKLFDSGYGLVGEEHARDGPRAVREHVERGRNFDLYLDKAPSFWDEHGDDVFDVHTRSFQWGRDEDMPEELARELAEDKPLPEGPGGT